MKIHILGICGTFMGGIAAIACELGHDVSGSDQNVYPPMSETLRRLGVTLQEGYQPEHLQPHPDLVIIGNALSRGNLAVEYVLNQHIPYVSGPQWLAESVLHHKHVLAVSGTHGKTTTSSMLAWVLEQAGLKPGYLIGGVAQGFTQTACLGDSDYFVIEADEYDTAFFDKRPKFLHYRPQTLVLNNIEFDHADIFADLVAIKRQFEYLLRTIPGDGLVIFNDGDASVQEVLEVKWLVLWTKLKIKVLRIRFWQELKALSVAPIDIMVAALGASAPTIIMGLLGWTLCCFSRRRGYGSGRCKKCCI